MSVLCLFQDLKDDTLKAEMGAARSILEKSTMMLLTTSKVAYNPTNNCVFTAINHMTTLMNLEKIEKKNRSAKSNNQN